MTVHRFEIRRKKRTVFKDFFPICFIALFGCFGFAYIFNSDCISEFNANSGKDIQFASHSLALNPYSPPQNEILKANGNLFSLNAIQFEIVNFSTNADYSLEFGNGEHLDISAPNFEYTFMHPGLYDLKLEIKYPSEKPISYSKKLLIEDGNQLSYLKNSESI